jgi:hypothetical protein
VIRRLVPAAAAALVGLAFVAGPAQARTIRVSWTDVQPLGGGGRVVYRTTKIWLHGDRFSVDVEVANRAKHDVMFFAATGPDDPTYIPRPGFGLAWREPPSPNIHTRHLRSVVLRSLSRRLPWRLGAGKTADLTFSGRSPLLRTHRVWWVTFGVAIPWQGKRPLNASGGGYWISDKTFRS